MHAILPGTLAHLMLMHLEMQLQCVATCWLNVACMLVLAGMLRSGAAVCHSK